MALNPADIAVVSRLLDEALELPASEREAWLAALPAEHQAHLDTLRDMLAQEAQLDTDDRLAELPRLQLDDSVAQAGDRVGPYRLIREIGQGGMGSVWLAERADGAYSRQVALKLPRLAWGAGLAERMAREREIGMLLEHPNIARLYDAGVDERGRPFLALEFVDGQRIDVWCNARGLDVRERLRLFIQVAKAVAYAHGRLVVHRDLKPSNVLVTEDGQAHLLDFGIAKLLLDVAPGEPGLTQEQGHVLTPLYASPEQVAGEAITVQSDVYSLGVLLYELLTGKTPYILKRDSLGAVEEAILTGEPAPASSRAANKAEAQALRGELDNILAKALQRAPSDRYATVDALTDDIDRHLNGDRVLAQPDSLQYRMSKVLRRHWLGVSASAAVLVALMVGLGATLTLYLKVLQAREATEAQAAVARSVNDYLVRDLLAAADPMSSEPPDTAVPAASAPPAGQVSVVAVLDRAARRAGERFKGQPALEASVRMSLGEAYHGNGAFREAAEQFLLARDRFSAAQVHQPLAEVDALLNAGQSLVDADQLEAGGQRLEEALAFVRSLGATAGPEAERLRIRVRQSQAALFFKQGQSAEAIQLMQPELPAIERAFGAESGEMANALARLSNFHLAQGRALDAVSTARQALGLRSRLSATHPVMLIEAHSHLADALRLSGDTNEALQQARMAYEMSRQLLGLDHKITLVAGNILASMLQETKQFEAAIALFEEVVSRSASRYGEDYFETLMMMNNLGLAYADAGRTSQAITILKRRLASGLRVLGPDHPENVLTEHNLADVLADGGRWDEALELEQRVLPRAQRIWGLTSIQLGAVYRTLGRVQMNKGRWAEARASLLEARRQFGTNLGDQHRRVLQVEQMLTEMEQKSSLSIARKGS